MQLALVEETIAYIAYLESILSASNDQVGPCVPCSHAEWATDGL